MRSNLRPSSRRWGLPVIALAAVLGAPLVAGAQQTASSAVALQLANATPESVGMSAERLARLTATFKKEIDDKKLPGAVMMIARQGKLAYATALGMRDPKSADAMRTDAIFRIYSMTKPIVSVAAMILVEDGALELPDPVAKWLPAFKDVKVFTGGGFVAAEPGMTGPELPRHTPGLAYG